MFNLKRTETILMTKEELGKFTELYGINGSKSNCFSELYVNYERLEVLKLYKDKEVFNDEGQNALSFANNSFLKRNNVVAPTIAVRTYDDRVGYLMELVNGYSLVDINEHNRISDISYNSFKKAYFKALKNIKRISKKGIVMDDLSDRNIMYDPKSKRFKFIDLDMWYYGEYSNDWTLYENISQFHSSFKYPKEYRKQFSKKITKVINRISI